MNANTQHFTRTGYDENSSTIGFAHSVHATKANFLAPIGLVCVLGCLARFIQACLLN